jgi:hypothetical protein
MKTHVIITSIILIAGCATAIPDSLHGWRKSGATRESVEVDMEQCDYDATMTGHVAMTSTVYTNAACSTKAIAG